MTLHPRAVSALAHEQRLPLDDDPALRSPSYVRVAEVFGPTVQGEGPHAGRLASFLRTSGCNLSCSWCDTPFTWDWQRFDRDAESQRIDVGDLAARLAALPGRIVVSGGEPLLQAPALAAVLAALPGRAFDVETNGTRPLGATARLWSTIVVSPKTTPSAQQGPRAAALRVPVRDERVHVKFVIADERDLVAADEWVEQHRPAPERVWLMPEGRDPRTLHERWRAVASEAIARGWNATLRLHTMAWGEERGR